MFNILLCNDAIKEEPTSCQQNPCGGRTSNIEKVAPNSVQLVTQSPDDDQKWLRTSGNNVNAEYMDLKKEHDDLLPTVEDANLVTDGCNCTTNAICTESMKVRSEGNNSLESAVRQPFF